MTGYFRTLPALFTLPALVLLLGLPLSAIAAGPYIGANYTQLEYQHDEADRTIRPDAVIIRAGIELTPLFGIEGRAGTGISADKRSVPGGEIRYELDRLVGAYGTLGIPVGDVARPYLVAGMTDVKGEVIADFNSVQFSESDSNSDYSLGAGIDLNISETFGINVEYMRYIDNDDEKLNGLSLGVRSAF